MRHQSQFGTITHRNRQKKSFRSSFNTTTAFSRRDITPRPFSSKKRTLHQRFKHKTYNRNNTTSYPSTQLQSRHVRTTSLSSQLAKFHTIPFPSPIHCEISKFNYISLKFAIHHLETPHTRYFWINLQHSISPQLVRFKNRVLILGNTLKGDVNLQT